MAKTQMNVTAFSSMLAVLLVTILTAQSKPAGPIPRTADGKPDFTGMWDNPKEPGVPGAATVFNKSKMAPFVPGGEALFYEPRTGDPRHDEPRAFCMPSGFPSAFLGPYPVQFIQTPQHLVMSTEFMNVTRIIPLDGRPHKTDIEPTFYGEPVGRWTTGTTRTRRSTGCTATRFARSSGCNARTPTRSPTNSPSTIPRSSPSPGRCSG
jgi:hypothetical protein